MSDWKQVELGTLFESISERFVPRNPEGVYFLNTSDVLEGKVSAVDMTPFEGLPGQAKKAIQRHDILYSEIRPANKRYGLVDFEASNHVVSTKLMVLRKVTDDSLKYLLLSITNEQFLRELQLIAEGRSGSFPQITFDVFKKLEITLPPLVQQEAIAEVLSSLDDKIDLLKRQNKTLESMAEALFRQWFIEGAQDDWEEVELQDLYKIKIGRTPPRKESEWFEDIESSQNWPWFSIKDMADCGTFISDSSEFITSEGQEKFKIPIIPPRTVVLSFKLTVGRVAITKRPMLSNEAIAHFIPSTTAPSDLVLFCFLKSLNYQSLGSTSSIAQAVNSGTIRKIQMPKFPQSLINRFDVLCSQWFDKINYNQEQLKVLKNKRSTLLPKLMSGEVRVQMD